MAYDKDYPDTYYCTIKGIQLRYCKFEPYNYVELSRMQDNDKRIEEIDITIRHKDALKYALQFLKTMLQLK